MITYVLSYLHSVHHSYNNFRLTLLIFNTFARYIRNRFFDAYYVCAKLLFWHFYFFVVLLHNIMTCKYIPVNLHIPAVRNIIADFHTWFTLMKRTRVGMCI